eukprot:s4156_g4.t1
MGRKKNKQNDEMQQAPPDPDIQQLAYTFKIDAGLTQKLNDIMIEKRMNTWEQDLERLYEILKDRCLGFLKCHRCLITGLRDSMALWVSHAGRSHPSGNAQLESERHAEGHLRWKGQVWSESSGSGTKAQARQGSCDKAGRGHVDERGNG